MAAFHPLEVQCACGAKFVAQLARSVNAGRAPDLRRAILKGTFHAFPCPSCQELVKVERPFLYTDLTRNCVFHVKPRSCRHEFKAVSKDLDSAMESFPAATLPRGKPELRAVFGLDELREKLVAQDLGMDDRLVELLKVLVIYEHPVLTRRARLRLTLEEASDSDLEFAAAYEHSPERFRISIPRSIASKLAENPTEVHRWVERAHGKQSVFKEPDHWVNLWRWSPQPSALDLLRTYAERARSGGKLNTASKDFKKMLDGLPRGTHLPPWAKRDLRTIEEYVVEHGPGKLEDALFEIRFGFKLEDDWARNDRPESRRHYLPASGDQWRTVNAPDFRPITHPRLKLEAPQQVIALHELREGAIQPYRPIFNQLILLISRVADGKKPLGLCVDSQVDSGFARKLLIQ